MTPRLGQALRWLKRLLSAALALLLVAALGLAGLAWRLAQGPLALAPLAREIERAVNRPGGPRVEIAEAAIAWEGWRGGTAPLDIRLSGVRLLDAAGTTRMDLPDAAVTLSLRALLRGTLAPATIALHDPRVVLVRAEDGSFGLAPEAPGGTAPPEAATDADAGEALLGLLRELMQPISHRSAHGALRRIRLEGGEIVVMDRALGRSWSLSEPRIDIRRAASGGLVAEGAASILSGSMVVPVRLTGSAQGTPQGTPMRLSLGIALPALRPPQLAEIWPPLAPLAVLDAPVSLAATAEFDAEARPERVHARLAAERGALALGPGRRLPFAALEAALEGSGRALRLTGARLALPGGPGAPGPSFAATGEAMLRDGAWAASLDLRAEPLPVAALAAAWPPDLSPEARQAALGALAAGTLREARLHLAVTAPEVLDRVDLAEAQLALAANGAVFGLGAGRRLATETAELAATLTPGALRLDRVVLRLPRGPAGPGSGPGSGATGPVVTASGEAVRQGALWRGRLGLGLDAVRFAGLAAHWPEGVVPGARDWIIQNVTAGEIRNGAWRIEAEAPDTLDAVRLVGLTGTAAASDATVHWLRPIPPLRGVSGSVEFTPTEVTIRGSGGRQLTADGGRSGLELREATVRFHSLDASPGQAEITVQLAGPLADAVAVVRHPRLKLFERRPLKLSVAAGQVDARLQVGFPLWADLPMEALRLRATARITEARLPGALLDQELGRANLDLVVDTESLKLSGQGLLVDAPVRLAMDMDFRAGPPAQVTERATLTGRMDGRQLDRLGLEARQVLAGPVALEARYERRRSGQGQVALRGDLRDAWLGVEAAGWAKRPGTPGSAEAMLRLQGDALQSLDSFRLEALELALRGRASFGPRSRLERVEITEGIFGGSRFIGEVRRPEREGGPWMAGLHGPLLDLRPLLGAPGHAEGGGAPTPQAAPAAGESGPPMLLDLRFDRVTMGEARNLLGVQGRVQTDARGLLREARASGRTAAQSGAFELTLAPRGQRRLLHLTAEDGGALLQALDLAGSIQGGRLTVAAAYDELRPGAALTGTAELDQFVLRDAPAAAKLLQAMTLYGMVEAMQGGSGLVFSRLVAPFSLTPEALALNDARAFSASLGITAKGRIWRRQRIADIQGTIVPAYVFNTLLGNIPILGRLFSPEAGGGLFAATFRVQGPLADPAVTVNPLAALTPGFLRGLFGILEPGRAPAR
ncbi:DUF3971 domain-containing protein [Siccirubricoccus sp. G192]|uniref:DUF3971 domain-containing protein n=1 Tax=Siccirubricoccus sp. G192 TaxID=2849651 RepID=UPI001C2C8551|nr:DUF3971 domain-containing protein [Siccirubricoccus sp. G192]MBV1796730.1 DUF3971 domain-containing protein [Siccirubricoccus sp. G192]